jgi:hypothetical protein
MPDVPQNTPYMVAGYVVAAVILLLYTVTLWRRGPKSPRFPPPPPGAPRS